MYYPYFLLLLNRNTLSPHVLYCIFPFFFPHNVYNFFYIPRICAWRGYRTSWLLKNQFTNLNCYFYLKKKKLMNLPSYPNPLNSNTDKNQKSFIKRRHGFSTVFKRRQGDKCNGVGFMSQRLSGNGVDFKISVLKWVLHRRLGAL